MERRPLLLLYPGRVAMEKKDMTLTKNMTNTMAKSTAVSTTRRGRTRHRYLASKKSKVVS